MGWFTHGQVWVSELVKGNPAGHWVCCTLLSGRTGASWSSQEFFKRASLDLREMFSQVKRDRPPLRVRRKGPEDSR